MKENGFTLVELLAVLIVLSIILTITVVSVSNVLSNSKDSLSETQKSRLEEAAEIYYLKEGMNAGATCINITDLVSKGYIESDEVLDPKTRKPLPGAIKIYSASNKYSYEYQTTNCPESA